MMVRPPVLFMSNPTPNCGVHQFGRNVMTALTTSSRFEFRYVECASAVEFLSTMVRHRPLAVIYNHIKTTMPWLNRALMLPFPGPHIGIVHEATQALADRLTSLEFDAYLVPDPTLLLRNPRVFKTGRLVPAYRNRQPVPSVSTVGSFGFGLEGKGFDRLLERVQAEFERADVRLHIPFAAYGDSSGEGARSIARTCEALVRKPGIRVAVTHEFLEEGRLLDFLAGNTLNAFFYDAYPGRGISSVIDHALAVGRPLALSSSTMFRHVLARAPQLCVDHRPLREVMDAGDAPLAAMRRDWCAENLVWEYERIVESALALPRGNLRNAAAGVRARIRNKAAPRAAGADWVPVAVLGGSERERVPGVGLAYRPDPALSPAFNRELDDEARRNYYPALQHLAATVPATWARKHPRANIQQAFVLDAAVRALAGGAGKTLLGVGSFEDTACGALKAMGIAVEEVDPLLNFDLRTYLDRPTVRGRTWDVVVATSVIEHVADDEGFMRDLGRAVAPGGWLILTCDYAPRWRPGMGVPSTNHRFYTRDDLATRLPGAAGGLTLASEPGWGDGPGDFEWEGFRYAFATLVLRREPGRTEG